MIDLHCHILPGIDDGPSTEADALALARAAVEAGTLAIVATPHVSWNYPGNTAALIAAGVARLTESLARERIPLQLHTGAEVALTRATDLTDAELIALRLGGPGGTHLLLECPMSPTAAGFEAVIANLRTRGHEIVLAHPERIPAFQRDPAAYERLIGQGLLGQVTAGALVGRFGRTVKEFGEHLVREGLAQNVASDAHSTERRPPTLGPDLATTAFGEQAVFLAHQVPYALLTGGEIPPAPEMPPAPARGLKRLLGR